MMDGIDAAQTACPNCATPLAGRYCAACGQKTAPLNPTIGHFLREVANEVFNLDGKIVRTVRLLVTRPGFLTQEVLAGRRASYVSPLRLYLFFSILSFAIGSVTPNVSYTPDDGETVDPQVQVELERTINAAARDWVPRAMFVLVPVFAALVMLVRWRSDLNYPQHLYFALHVHAFWFLVNALSSLVDTFGAIVARFVPLATALLWITYFVLAFRRVYGTAIWGTVWRAAIVSVLYFAALVAAMAAIFLPPILDVINGSQI